MHRVHDGIRVDRSYDERFVSNSSNKKGVWSWSSWTVKWRWSPEGPLVWRWHQQSCFVEEGAYVFITGRNRENLDDAVLARWNGASRCGTSIQSPPTAR